MQGRDSTLGSDTATEWPDVVGVVVEHRPNDRQPRPRLSGELEPGDLVLVARAPVVGRFVMGDESQLADLGLQGRGARDAFDALGDLHHLGHPGAGLTLGEIAPRPGTDVA